MNDKTKSGLLKAALIAIAGLGFMTTPAGAARISNPVASFSGLDKITGRITSFDVYVGETVQFGALQVTPKACFNRDASEAQRVDAFVEVDEITLDRKIKRIFTGWMFAESPALNAIEHPIFDVWLKECRQTTSVPPPKDLKIPPSGPDPLAAPAPQADGTATAPAEGQPAEAPATPAPANPLPPDAPVEQAPLGAPAPDGVAPADGQAPVDQALPEEALPSDELPADQLPADQIPVEPLPQDQQEALPPLEPPADVGPVDPDPGFGLPPETVPDDGLGGNGQDGNFPPPPPGGQQGLSGGGLF